MSPFSHAGGAPARERLSYDKCSSSARPGNEAEWAGLIATALLRSSAAPVTTWPLGELGDHDAKTDLFATPLAGVGVRIVARRKPLRFWRERFIQRLFKNN